MGLCKCPKRRVTNQFCFEHHANVCEHCMVTNHKKCIVQSYLQWLQDSDYNPVCELCSKDLGAEDCVRLTCYHVFHWWCLDTWARNLPPDTAPAGYTCPSCHSALFPAANLVSPVADVLKEKLAGVNWARTGLGLPLLSEEVSQPINRSVSQSSALPNNIPISSPAPPPPHSVIHVPDNTFARVEGSGPRRTTSHDHHTSGSETSTLLFDHDEDKYKRRSPSEWVLRRWKSIWSSGRSRRHWRPVVAIFAVVIFILLLMAALGRNNQNNDSDFDFQNNPHIRNNDG